MQKARLRNLIRQRDPVANQLCSLCPEKHTEEEASLTVSCLFLQILSAAYLLLLLQSHSSGNTLNKT